MFVDVYGDDTTLDGAGAPFNVKHHLVIADEPDAEATTTNADDRAPVETVVHNTEGAEYDTTKVVIAEADETPRESVTVNERVCEPFARISGLI